MCKNRHFGKTRLWGKSVFEKPTLGKIYFGETRLVKTSLMEIEDLKNFGKIKIKEKTTHGTCRLFQNRFTTLGRGDRLGKQHILWEKPGQKKDNT